MPNFALYDRLLRDPAAMQQYAANQGIYLAPGQSLPPEFFGISGGGQTDAGGGIEPGILPGNAGRPDPTPSPTPIPITTPSQSPSIEITGGFNRSGPYPADFAPTTLPPDQNPFGQYTPPTQVTVPPDQFSMGVQPPLQDWSYNPDFSNSFNTPQTFNPDMGFQSSDRFLNPSDYLSMGNPSAPGNAIQSFGGNPIDWGAQLPSIPNYPAYQAPSQGGTNISGFGGNASLGYDFNIPAQSLWTQANYGATGPASVGGTNISGFGGNTSLGYDFNAPVQDYWTQQTFDTGGTASQGGNLSLGGYGNPDPQWSGSLFDPNIYASGGNNAISSFGGLNDPSSFDITGGQSLGYVPQPGTNFYDNGDGTRYVYDSDWNYLGTQTSSAPAGSGGGSGGGSSTGVANSTPSPGSSSGIPGSIVSIGRSGNTFLQSPTGQIMGSVGGPTSMVPLPGSGFALSGVGAPGLIQLGAAGGWGTWTSGAGLSPEYILETPSGARSQARASKSPLDPYHAGLGKSAGASMFTKAG